MIFNLMKPAPTTESATMYLYGREAKADETPTAYIGDVGYKGVVAPSLPTWDKETYPYVMVAQTWTNIFACYFLREIPTVKYQPDHEYLQWYQQLTAPFLESTYFEDTNTWGEFKTIEMSYNRSAVWANFDVKTEDGTLLLSATDPIPVELVGYSYNGTVLPALPEEDKEKYPYITIAYQKFFHFDYEDRWGEVVPTVHFATLPFGEIDGGDLVNAEGTSSLDSPTIDMVEYFLVDGKWMCRSENSWSMFAIITESLVFANYDILSHNSGEVYLSASEPVPVYE